MKISYVNFKKEFPSVRNGTAFLISGFILIDTGTGGLSVLVLSTTR